MYDIHALSSGGGTTLTDITTILLGGDGQTTAGVPVRPGGVLTYWGGMTTIADTIRELRLLNNDMPNPRQGQYFVLGASSLIGALTQKISLRSNLQRLIAMRQNTAGANNMAFLIDYYQGGSVWTPGKDLSNVIVDQNVFAALTAITWGSKAYVPTVTLESGKYAILGVWVNALTNYALLRFEHNDFAGFKPGFPVVDSINTSVARAVDPARVIGPDGYQFVAMGECPVFTAGQDSSGLVMWMASITADSPNVNLNLKRVA